MIIYKKHPQFDEEARALSREVNDFLEIPCETVDIYHLYQFKDEQSAESLIPEIFDPRYGMLVTQLPAGTFYVKDNEGQYIQTQDLTLKYLRTVLGRDNDLRYFKGYHFAGTDPKQLATIKRYLINPVVQKEVTLADISFDYEISDEAAHETVTGFNAMSADKLAAFRADRGVGLDVDDLQVIQQHFAGEGRDPRFCEIKMLDTYWSDHCRHTTFLTNLDKVEILPGRYQELVAQSFRNYLAARAAVYGGREAKPISLMDLATIMMKDLKQRKLLTDMEDSTEVNACSIEVDIEVNGEKQRWLHLFKNETHNHPTEIEPYGGAHTCIGGGIRDPLSGRGEVIQGIRIVGAGNPLTPFAETLDGKLSQRYLATMAVNGFSDYANQIGSTVGLVKEYYDDGFVAKRMELGALTAAVRKDHITRAEAEPGDMILLLGAPTGRDGLGAAVGSSSAQTEKSLKKAGAEVQKGNPFAERKIIRLFKRPEATKLIKKCNDFGAGGVSVAIGELADGLDIDLNAVYTKYPGMNGYENALSESQERMAVVIARKDLDRFAALCEEEDVRFAVVANVTDTNRLKMYWNGAMIMDLSRDLLNSSGAVKHAGIQIDTDPKSADPQPENARLIQSLGNNLSGNFDSTLGRGKVFAEYGGKQGLTAQDGIVTKFPVEGTKAVSVMTYAYLPQWAKTSMYHGGYYAALQSIVKNLAITGRYNDIRLSMQEFFPSIKGDPQRFGLPFAALLGVFEVMSNLDIPAIGGKDSMSGTFKHIDVPPTLVSFAVNTSECDRVVSRELKWTDSNVLLTNIPVDADGMVDFAAFTSVMAAYMDLHQNGQVLAASAVSEYGLAFTLQDMALGNGIGLEVTEAITDAFLPGNLVLEVPADTAVDERYFKVIARTKAGADHSALIEARCAARSKVYGDILVRLPNAVPAFEERSLPALTQKGKKVLIPVLDGATGEYDLENALTNAGFDVTQFVIKTETHAAYMDSLKQLAAQIAEVNLVVIPHGDYFASVIRNIAGAMSKVLHDPSVNAALKVLLERGGFLIGSGAGMAALVDAGFFGDIANNLQFVPNRFNQYVHAMQDVTVVKNSYLTSPGQLHYTAPISGKNITIRCANMDKLQEQIDVIAVNTTHLLPDDCGIDMIASKVGHVIGIRSLIERMGPDLYRNIAVSAMPDHFKILAGHLA